MRYVIDSSVALKWVVPEVDAIKARRLRDESRAGIHELLAPGVFPTELAHALTRAERQTRIAVGDASLLWGSVVSDFPRLEPSLPLRARAIAVSSSARIGVYDYVYVALAEREGCEFVTADARLVANMASRFPFIIPLSSLP
jgi:predicted nucleic acid-binding protein